MNRTPRTPWGWQGTTICYILDRHSQDAFLAGFIGRFPTITSYHELVTRNCQNLSQTFLSFSTNFVLEKSAWIYFSAWVLFWPWLYLKCSKLKAGLYLSPNLRLQSEQNFQNLQFKSEILEFGRKFLRYQYVCNVIWPKNYRIFECGFEICSCMYSEMKPWF